MSSANVELVKALLAQPDTDIASFVRDEDRWAAVREALGPVLADDFQSVMVFPVERLAEGLEGLRQNWLDWLEPWAAYRSTTDEVIDAGERVVVLYRDYGRREDVDAEVELVGAAIWTIREGKVARIEHHADRGAALQAAGLAGDTHTST
jgi:hypothetical protein